MRPGVFRHQGLPDPGSLLAEMTGPPRFLENPQNTCRALRPRRDLRTRPFGASILPSGFTTPSAPAIRILSRLYNTACILPVYASPAWLPMIHATLGSSWWPALAGQDSLPAGFLRKVSTIRPSCPPFPDFTWRNVNICASVHLEEMECDVSWPPLMQDLSQVHAVRLELDGRNYLLRTDLEGIAHQAFLAAGVRPPSRVTHLD